jgi:phosphatidylserine/phosphatidylglycerophosphate/cardiolipin synthase-like enzyme
MKKRRLKSWAQGLLILCAVSLLVFYLIQIGPTFIGASAKQEQVVESSATVVPKEVIPAELTDWGIEVYFCPRDNCEQHLFELLDSATVSIHCAVYELNLPRIVSLLENKSRQGVDVRLVVDNEYYDEVENLSFARQDGKQGLMHNKFCVVDGKRVYTGSMNPTRNCAYRNDNNMVIVESRYLSQNYEGEFSELWAGMFGKGERVRFPEIVLNNMSVRNYFCPEDDCRGRVRAEIAKANLSIYFLAFSFTDDFLGQDLLLKKEGGVDVRGVFERTKISNYSEYQLLGYQGVDVRLDGNKYNMHHKLFIIDSRTVITGSYNPTANANFDNDENILVIEDEGIARRFLGELDRVYDLGTR